MQLVVFLVKLLKATKKFELLIYRTVFLQTLTNIKQHLELSIMHNDIHYFISFILTEY